MIQVPPTALSLLAAGSWGAADFCGGLAARRASPYQVVAVAHGLSLAFLLTIALATRSPFPATEFVVFAMGAGIAGGLGLAAFYKSLSLGNIGLNASLAGILNTAIPVLFSLALLGRPRPVQLAGFAIALIAVTLIAYVPGGGARSRGLGLAALAGVGFGLLLILLNRAAPGGILWALTLSRAASTTMAGVLVFLQMRNSGDRRAHAWREALTLAALVGVLDTGGNFLYTAASVAGRLDTAAVISSLYPAVTILMAIWLLRERATRQQAAGMALALLAVALISA